MNIRIKSLDDYGRGIAFINDKITFIPNTLTDELIEYKIINEKKKFNEAQALKIFDKNTSRINPPCPYFSICGGCNLQHMSLELENDFKINKVKNILRKFASIEVETLEITSLKDYYYRNKITLSVNNQKLGLLKEKTNELVEIDKCLLVNDKLNKVIEILKILIKKEPAITKIMLRIGNITDEVMLNITGNVKNIADFIDICDSLIINNKVITKEYITSYILDKKFIIHSNSFFQINDEIVANLYSEIVDVVKKIHSKNILDLYCGVGTIGLTVAPYVNKVLGVEVVKEAIIDANKNKELNKVSNIKFINSKVEDIINSFESSYDTIILDPPRSGLDNKTKEYLKKLNPKNIIYVSCDPITLARDLKDLKELYEVENIKLFNMFPRTYHVECVCVLNRR